MFIEKWEKCDYVRFAHELDMELERVVISGKENPTVTAVLNANNFLISVILTDDECIALPSCPFNVERANRVLEKIMSERFVGEYENRHGNTL